PCSPSVDVHPRPIANSNKILQCSVMDCTPWLRHENYEHAAVAAFGAGCELPTKIRKGVWPINGPFDSPRQFGFDLFSQNGADTVRRRANCKPEAIYNLDRGGNQQPGSMSVRTRTLGSTLFHS